MTEDKDPRVSALGMTKNAGGKAKKTKKGRKVGRNSLSCRRYKLEHRRERNKLRKLYKHVKVHNADFCAMTAIDLCKVTLGLR